MKLRSHGVGASSSRGKAKLKYKDSSEEDDGGEIPSSDSDYNVASDEGEDLLDALETSRERETFELNFASETGLGISDDEGFSKRRRTNSSGRVGRQSSKTAQEDEGQGYADGDNETAIGIGIGPGKTILTGGVVEKNGRKKKGKKTKDNPVLMWEVIEQENDRWIEENLQIDMDLINQNFSMFKY